MVAVWTHRGGQRWKPADEWQHVVNFWTLDNLMSQLEEMSLKGRVTKLGIVAHGDKPGVVQLDHNLTVASLGSFAGQLSRLRSFLPYGSLIFFACTAGAGTEGDRFLCELSKLLPGIKVVGFTEENWVPGTVGPVKGVGLAGDFAPTPAGTVYPAGFNKARDPASYRGKPRLTEYHPTAKWAANGWIVRPALAEVYYMQGIKDRDGNATNPEKLCGSENCMGHSQLGHFCHGYKRHPQTVAAAENASLLLKSSYGADAMLIDLPHHPSVEAKLRVHLLKRTTK